MWISIPRKPAGEVFAPHVLKQLNVLLLPESVSSFTNITIQYICETCCEEGLPRPTWLSDIDHSDANQPGRLSHHQLRKTLERMKVRALRLRETFEGLVQDLEGLDSYTKQLLWRQTILETLDDDKQFANLCDRLIYAEDQIASALPLFIKAIDKALIEHARSTNAKGGARVRGPRLRMVESIARLLDPGWQKVPGRLNKRSWEDKNSWSSKPFVPLIAIGLATLDRTAVLLHMQMADDLAKESCKRRRKDIQNLKRQLVSRV